MPGKRVVILMKVSVRKRSFFEIVFSLTVVFFVCIGTSFIDHIGASTLRWICIFLLFVYLFLNKKLLRYINHFWQALFLTYLSWCILTTLWSNVPILSFSKSMLFSLNVIVLLSAGSFWVIKYGYEHSLRWLFLLLVIALISGLKGGASAGSIDNYGSFNLYAGLNGNANAFGFLMAVISPFIFIKLYENKAKKSQLALWVLILILDVHFLAASYSRSSAIIFTCVFGFFTVSLPLSKKIVMSFFAFFCITIMLLMMPTGYLENLFLTHIIKFHGASTTDNANVIFQSRDSVWKKSIARAERGGLMGGGFAASIGNNKFSGTALSSQVSAKYGHEKGNSQLAILEETGIVGFVLYIIFIFSFFFYAISSYLRLHGTNKVFMGVTLGVILGLLLESLVEGWWDSAAGPEVICFWTFVGIIFGMIYLQKRQLDNVGAR